MDKGRVFGVLLTDLLKAFDCLSYESIIAKSNAYGFSLSALKLMQSCLSERKQIAKTNQTYSSWEEILFGVTQGSILGPIYLTFFLVIYFLFCKMFILQESSKKLLNGSLIIKLKLVKINVI